MGRKMISKAANISVLALVFFCLHGCSDDPEKIIKSVLEKDHQLAVDIRLEDKAFKSSEEQVVAYKKSIDSRSELITLVKTLKVSEKDALIKRSVLEFMELENTYCQSAAQLAVFKQYLDRSGSGLFRAYDPNVAKAVREVSQLHGALAQREANLIPHGWSYVWNGEKSTENLSTVEKPAELASSQWRFVQENDLKALPPTEKYYIWIKKLPSDDGAKVVLAAYKNRYGKDSRYPEGPGKIMYISKRHFFCKERLMIKSESKMMDWGGMASSPEGNISTPSTFDDSRASDILFAEMCEQSNSFLGKLMFWKSEL